MKLGIITYATGWYLVYFLESFLESFTNRYVPGVEKEFIVIIDDENNVKSYIKELKNIKFFKSSFSDRNGKDQLRLKWHDLLKFSNEFSSDVTHICHAGNVNQYVVHPVSFREIDPGDKVATLFSAESRDYKRNSFFDHPGAACHCPYENCQHYVHGNMQFASAKGFKVLAKAVQDRLDQDMANGINVPWDDETSLNSVLMKNPTKFRVIDHDHRIHFTTHGPEGEFSEIPGVSKIVIMTKNKFSLSFLSYYLKKTPYCPNPFKFLKIDAESAHSYRVIYSNGLKYVPVNDTYEL